MGVSLRDTVLGEASRHKIQKVQRQAKLRFSGRRRKTVPSGRCVEGEEGEGTGHWRLPTA